MYILLVEDQYEHYSVFNEALSDLGHTCEPKLIWAKNSDDAINKVQQEKVDVAFIDIVLKGSKLDGIELISYFREKLKKAFPIVTYSISQSEKDKKRSYAAGANLYAGKPFDLDYLLSIQAYVINSVLSGEPLME